jgi:hypothetical protein
VEFFVVGRRVSGSADDQAVSSRLGDFNQDNLGVVAAQDAFNPVEQPGEKCKLSPVTRVALGAVRRKNCGYLSHSGLDACEFAMALGETLSKSR